MHISIIADLHDNLHNWKKINNILVKQDIKHLIIAGDITSVITLDQIAREFPYTIHAVFGNADQQIDYMSLLADKYNNLNIYGYFGEFVINKKKIIVSHYQEEVEAKAEDLNADIICCGHSHRAIKKQTKNYILINPGTAGGIFAKASFAVYDINREQVNFIDI